MPLHIWKFLFIPDQCCAVAVAETEEQAREILRKYAEEHPDKGSAYWLPHATVVQMSLTEPGWIAWAQLQL